MAVAEYVRKTEIDALDAWHLELAIVQEVVVHLLGQIEGPEWMSAAGYLVSRRLAELVEGFPLPSRRSDGEEVGQTATGLH